MLPRNLEIVLYLLLHQDRWSADLIAQIRRVAKDEDDNLVLTTPTEIEQLRKNGEYDEF